MNTKTLLCALGFLLAAPFASAAEKIVSANFHRGTDNRVLNGNLRLTRAHITGGGVAIDGFQIVGHELDEDIQSVVEASLCLSVGNVPPGFTLGISDSIDLASGFKPVVPPLTFDSTTLQPLFILIDTIAQPERFFSIAPAPPE